MFGIPAGTLLRTCAGPAATTMSIRSGWWLSTKRGAEGAVVVLGSGQQWVVNDIAEAERMRLFRLGEDGLPEPLWLNQTGTPMRSRSWNQIFRVTNLAERLQLTDHRRMWTLGPDQRGRGFDLLPA